MLSVRRLYSLIFTDNSEVKHNLRFHLLYLIKIVGTCTKNSDCPQGKSCKKEVFMYYSGNGRVQNDICISGNCKIM